MILGWILMTPFLTGVLILVIKPEITVKDFMIVWVSLLVLVLFLIGLGLLIGGMV